MDICDAEIVEELFLLVCLELPDTLEAFEVDEATELEDDILDNVESVETGDIVDVLPNPPPPTPPENYIKRNIAKCGYPTLKYYYYCQDDQLTKCIVFFLDLPVNELNPESLLL